MNNELIQIQVGQCGNQIGYQFYETLVREHSLLPINNNNNNHDQTSSTISSSEHHHLNDDNDQQQLNSVFFNEHDKNKWSPRAVLVDTDPSCIHHIQEKEVYGRMFLPNYHCVYNHGSGGNWAIGHYTTMGVELVNNVLDTVRKQAENCDNLHGFQLVHSLGGGTGSGLGTLILSRLREEFPEKIMSTCSIFPSPKMSDVVVEPYNCILSMHQLIENADLVYCYDNESLFDIETRLLGITNPGYKEMNQLIARVMSDATCSFRFHSSHLKCGLRKLATNFVPFPRLHFALISHAPLNGSSLNVAQLFQQVTNSNNVLSGCDPLSGRYMTALATFRGSMTLSEVQNEIISNNSDYLNWVDCELPSLKANVCNKTSNGEEINTATLIGNSTSIQYMFKRIEEQFDKMFKRKAFLGSFCYDGMDEMEFTEAQYNVRDLIVEYQQHDD